MLFQYLAALVKALDHVEALRFFLCLKFNDQNRRQNCENVSQSVLIFTSTCNIDVMYRPICSTYSIQGQPISHLPWTWTWRRHTSLRVKLAWLKGLQSSGIDRMKSKQMRTPPPTYKWNQRQVIRTTWWKQKLLTRVWRGSALPGGAR